MKSIMEISVRNFVELIGKTVWISLESFILAESNMKSKLQGVF